MEVSFRSTHQKKYSSRPRGGWINGRRLAMVFSIILFVYGGLSFFFYLHTQDTAAPPSSASPQENEAISVIHPSAEKPPADVVPVFGPWPLFFLIW